MTLFRTDNNSTFTFKFATMKTNIIQIISAFLILSFLSFQCSSSKKTGTQTAKLNSADVENMVSNKNFIFVAERVNPLRGMTRNLTSEYDVMIFKDSLVSYLPYFGRAYQAPINPNEGGIQFTSTDFSYATNSTKNKSWMVSVKPRDNRDIQELSFNIFDNGTATLNVTSLNIDPISFTGYVKRNKMKNIE